MPGALIAFSGVDCSGKSTQLELLARYLESRGRAVRTLWYRPGYSRGLDSARALARRLLRRSGGSALPTATDDKRVEAFARPGVSTAWIIMATIDAALQYAAKVRWWRRRGHTVLVDRYLLDAALDLQFRFPDHTTLTASAIASLEATCPRPDVHLLLMLPHSLMLERAAAKNEPFPDSPEVRDARYAAYAGLATAGHVTVIDAAGAIDEVHQRIVRALGEVGLRVAG